VKTTSTIALLALFQASMSVSQAAMVIDFNPGAASFSRILTTDSPSLKEVAFNTTVPFFNGSIVGGRKLYGGFYAVATGAADGTAQATFMSGQNIISTAGNIMANATKGAFTSPGTASTSTVVTSKFFAFYDSAEFLTGGSITLDLTEGSSFSLAGAKTNAAGASFVIRDGAQFYISQSNNTSGGFLYALNGTSLSWAAFNPANWTGFVHGTTPAGLGVGATGSFVAQTFTNVTGVGYIIGAGRAAGNSPSVSVSDFRVNLVPEPSAALLGGLGMLALLRRRRA
jgi:hypothetical protein